ncbi:hypothetical protein JXQ31_04110 [candidate division KSB1 bacterium]|nr:hypothetical protein [candidate division KSB1 bacterium]
MSQQKPDVILPPKSIDLYKIPFADAQIQKLEIWTYAEKQAVWILWPLMKDATEYYVWRRTQNGSYSKPLSKAIAWPQTETDACQLYDIYFDKIKQDLDRAHIWKVVWNAIQTWAKLNNVQLGEWFSTCPPFTHPQGQAALTYLSEIYPQLALIIGRGYTDSAAVAGTSYYYKVTYKDDSGDEFQLGYEKKVTAGVEKKPSKPTGLTVQEGDEEIMLLWNDPPPADSILGYHVYRSANQSGPFARLDSIPVLLKVTTDLNGDSLKTPRFGFIDTTVTNYKTYYYRVAARSLLGKAGPMSGTIAAMAKDLTAPEIPRNLNIATEAKTTLMISWNHVTNDINGRNEIVKSYYIYKYTDKNTAMSDSLKSNIKPIGTVNEPVPQPGMVFIFQPEKGRYFSDSAVIPEKIYWYRVACEDTAGNFSNKSAAIYGILPDYEPPDPPVNISAEGYDTYINIHWQKPDVSKKKNRDIAGFLLYRGICGGTRDEEKQYHPYPLHLLANIDDSLQTSYKDESLPKGSPICYRYAVKAFDRAQNLSAMSDSVCERLQDKTPPDPPVVTALQAKNKSVKIECVAPPVQDMKGFIIQRSESRDSGYITVYRDSAGTPPECDEMPSAEDIKKNKVNRLSFIDNKVNPEKIYWYKALAFDLNNNPSEFSPPVSTYTFELKSMLKPSKLLAKVKDCTVVLQWQEEQNNYPETFNGFYVFRSFASDHGYRKIAGPIKKNTFTDTKVVAGMSCWYKVQAVDDSGDRSPLSDAVLVNIK